MHASIRRPARRPGRRLTALAAAALIVVGAAACGDDSGSATGGSAPATSGASSAPIVVMDKVMYVTRELKITTGTSVEFDNKDNQAHTATSDANTFDTGLIEAGQKANLTFDKAGTYAYHCSLHPFMTAQIIVS